MRSRAPAIENTGSSQEETTDADRTYAPTRGCSPAHPLNQAAVTGHVVHRKSTGNDQRVDRRLGERSRRLGYGFYTIRGHDGAAEHRNHYALIGYAAIGLRSTYRGDTKSFQRTRKVEQ